MISELKDKYVLCIILSALLMGCMFIFFIKPFPGADFAVYQRLGWNLSHGNGYSDDPIPPYTPMGWRTPLYPIFLAAIYKLFGFNNTIVFIFQAILYALTALFLFLATKEILSRRIAYFAGFLFAIYPISAYWVGVLYNETLATFLLILVTYFLIRYVKMQRITYFCLTCFLIALCMLNRPVFALYPLFILLSLLFFKFSIKKNILHLFLAFSITLITLSPWIIRNYYVYNKFIPLTEGSGSGFSFYLGTIQFRNGWDITTYENDPLFIKQINEMRSLGYIDDNPVAYVNKDKIFLQYAMKNIRAHPFLYIHSYFKSLVRLYIPAYNPAFNRPVIILGIIFSVAILLLSAIGIWLLRKNVDKVIMLLLPLFYVTVMQLPFLSTSRYTIPARPYIMVLVAVVFQKLLESVKRTKIYGQR